MNLVSAILNHARTRPDATALAEADRELDYRGLSLAVTRTASRLIAIGLARGDRIGLCLKDNTDHIVLFLAAAFIGAAAVSLDWRARPEEIGRITRSLGLKRVIAEPEARVPQDDRAVVVDNTWHRAVARSQSLPRSEASWHDAFTVSTSSGSTGTPKFLSFSHFQYFCLARGVLEALALTGPQRFLCTLPLCFASAPNRIIAHLVRGDCVVQHPNPFSAFEYLDVARRSRATVGVLVPSTVRQLLADASDPPLLPGLVNLSTTGAPLSASEKLQASRVLSANFCDAYGTSEIGLLTLLAPSDLRLRPESVGQPHSLIEIEIVDDDHVALPVGEAGRLRYRGPALGSPVAPLDGLAAPHGFRDGWHYPDEIAYLDNRSFLFLRGRASDVINRGGMKFYPVEIENVLQANEGVAEVAVLGRPREGFDDDFVAFVVSRGERQAGELLAHCRRHLAAQKVPRRIRFIPQLPRTASGKVDKVALAKLMELDP